MIKQSILLFIIVAIFFSVACSAQQNQYKISVSEIGPGWSKTSVNAPIFRKNSIVSANDYQFVAYYDSTATVVLAKRKIGELQWELHHTQYKGNVYDAHNVIGIMIDGDGYLHMSWDHHNNPLNYCKSVEPYSLKMTEKQSMTGDKEQVVSYPEFFRFSNGDLLFAYRDGGSGNGNLVLNRYCTETKLWKRLQTNLIDGEGKRNAYWQIHIDINDHILVSWVWRDTPDVATNHDMSFARSCDGGITWINSKGEPYQLPINKNNAEVIYPIPQNSNLINQTSMTSDDKGNVYIATYYRDTNDSCTNFHLIYSDNNIWKQSTITRRSVDFNLSGIGSRSIPISRPQVVVSVSEEKMVLHVIYRDEEQDNKVCISSATVADMNWKVQTVSLTGVGRWEPSFDTELWKNRKQLHLFLQHVGQGQAETADDLKPQMVGVLEVSGL